MGYDSPMPHIQCSKGGGLQINGSYNVQQMKVTLSRLLVSQSSIMVQDSSVYIDGCRFEGSNQGVVINIRTRLSLNILVTNSFFYNNSACISVLVNSTTKQPKNIQVVTEEALTAESSLCTIDVFSLNQNNFTNNTAVKGGGALYIKAV